MLPKELILKWVEIFNQANAGALAELYDSSAINHQVNFLPVEGKNAIKKCLKRNLQKQKWGALLKIFLEMVNGQSSNGKIRQGLGGVAFSTL